MTDDTNTNDPVEQFREAYPNKFLDGVKEISRAGASIYVDHKEGKTICPRITEPLLESGWVVASASNGNDGDNHRFYYRRLDAEIRTTICEEVVGSFESVNDR